MKQVPVYFVQANNEAAMRLVRKLCDKPMRGGDVIPLDADEWAALQSELVCLRVDQPE